jgi:hypothetical protein
VDGGPQVLHARSLPAWVHTIGAENHDDLPLEVGPQAGARKAEMADRT